MSSYAIISVGGKQYRVREGEKLLVDRLKTDEGKTFHPDILFAGGDGKADLEPKTQVTAKVARPRERARRSGSASTAGEAGYRRHNGYRSTLSQIEITAIGAKQSTPEKKPAAAAKKPAAAAKKPASHDDEGRELDGTQKGLGSSRNGRDSQAEAPRREDLRRPDGEAPG